MSPLPSEKRPFVDPAKIGECAAQQPLSGVGSVDESGTVHGMSHGGYLRMTRAESVEQTSK